MGRMKDMAILFEDLTLKYGELECSELFQKGMEDLELTPKEYELAKIVFKNVWHMTYKDVFSD